jgi:long-subunit acyl-CoA synthetase (AMP-forming)
MMESFERWQEHEFVSEPLPEPAPASQRQSKTYKQVYDDALQWAGWLREKGVRVGDKVAIGARNSSRWVVFLAIADP